MTLQNRVDPFGALTAHAARGAMFGNRGGKFHRDDRTLGSRRHVSRRWISCVLEFNGRRRDVWGRFYTELFFLDEATALAAGHRPCYECRRHAAQAFAAGFAGGGAFAKADDMDAALHAERLAGRAKRTHRCAIDALPDAAFVTFDGRQAFAVKGEALLPWSFAGYGAPAPRPRNVQIEVLTPPSILRALRNGYQPLWAA